MLKGLLSMAVLAAMPQLAAAQIAVATGRASFATVTGVVHDSIGSTPLAGATVQLVGMEGAARVGRTTVSDSLGRFTIDSVPPGRYSLGFFHPILESLGIEPPLRELSLNGERLMRTELSTPSPGSFREAVCGSGATSDSSGVVVGVVRDGRDLTAAGGVSVTGEWLELTIARGGVSTKVPHIVATTGPNGWFAMCGVPGAGTLILRASRNADSVDRIEVEVPENRVVRRDLFLGSGRAGTSVLSGTVTTMQGGQALLGARVGIVGGPQTRANDRGEWSLQNAPAGTRMLEVRAVGYYPDRRAVNVIPGAVPVTVKLSTLQTVLETIKVTGVRTSYERSGFTDRRRTGAGKYLTADDVAKKGAIATSDIFKTIPGLYLEPDSSSGEPQILMRGPFGKCSPTIFVDGMLIPDFSADGIDDYLSPKEVSAVEIYSEASVPPQFKNFTKMDVCGSIVIWRK